MMKMKRPGMVGYLVDWVWGVESGKLKTTFVNKLQIKLVDTILKTGLMMKLSCTKRLIMFFLQNGTVAEAHRLGE